LKPAILLLCMSVLSVPEARGQDDDFLYDTFPEGFLWGTATSSYQIEGGWDADGKGEQIWDRWTHQGGRVRNNDTGDIACDSYNRYEEDIRIMSNMGVDFYRFSLSWARILPDGTIGTINEPGIDYYNRLIDGLLAAGIEPMVTLYHWDLPQALQEHGGWENVSIVQHFNDFAALCFERFGDRVKLWLTFNEPWVVTWLGYGIDVFAPGVYGPDVTTYVVTHHIIKSHAEAWHTYDRQFRATQHGKISITLDIDWKEPLTNSTADIQAADRAVEFKLGWFANAILVNGDYPEVMKTNIARKSFEEGRSESRLPEFTFDEKIRNYGTYDFLGINHYSTSLVRHQVHGTEWPSWEMDRDVDEYQDPSWPSSGSDWLKVVPWGIRRLLVWIKDHYGNPEVFITENGVSDIPAEHGTLNDHFRVNFYREYINNVLKAVKLDGCRVIGYTAWSLMDNFEWNDGYEATFGLHRIDFDDPTRARIPKLSAEWYTTLIANNGWPTPPEVKSP
jgi:beta-glucosidase/6-phospho-beta-glucosidase/beta-galactosidase